jgi:hypothetical protein
MVMTEYNYTEYFEKEVLRKRPYLKKEWCIRVIENPLRVESQQAVKNSTASDSLEQFPNLRVEYSALSR